jgi:uncharacterized protein (DUF2062 family)
MIFRRRDPRGVLSRIRDAFSPRKGWRRGFEYIGRRVQRLPDTPHRIALGAGCGVLASFTPFFTLHIVVAILLAMLARANVVAAALGTLFGNPLTFPMISAVSLSIGAVLLPNPRGEGAPFDIALVFTDFAYFLDNVFLPYLVGGLGPGLLAAVAVYAFLRPVIALYQARRRLRRMAVARRRVRDRSLGRTIKKNPVPEGLE